VSAWNLTLSRLGVPTAASSAARERISDQSSAEAAAVAKTIIVLRSIAHIPSNAIRAQSVS
jgi:hypothetical protein